jgi:hypothetical protein
VRDVILNAYLQDTDRAMILDSSGRYERPAGASASINAQKLLLDAYTMPAE